jgi:hypothetical protein
VKLYFMLGLPGEREEDLEGIVDLSFKALQTARNRGQVTVSPRPSSTAVAAQIGTVRSRPPNFFGALEEPQRDRQKA